MGIDHFFLGTAGCRNRELKKGERRYERKRQPNIMGTPFSVRLNHGHGILDGTPTLFTIDQLFYFETEEDARWFASEGYKGMLYDGETSVESITLIIYERALAC